VTVTDITERELIERISKRLPPAPKWMLVGLGDDAAVVEPERNRVEVLTVDAIVEGVHFDRAFVPPDAIGHRALAVNLSDIAAMGAAPRLALLSMALPAALPLDAFDQMVEGFVNLAGRYRVHVAGGNLTRSTGPLMIDVTLLGTVKRRQALVRSGAKPGDEIFVSGAVGAATAGLQMLQAGAPVPDAASACVAKYLRPEPRVRLGTLLARNRAASACMDTSDGLADAVHQMAASSGVGAVIDAAALPIDTAACQWFAARQLDPVAEALAGGDDYELVAAIRPRMSRRFRQLAQSAGVQVTCVGRCTEDRSVLLRLGHGETATERPLERPAFRHFQ
jgi:thiamine-monophosphate kinase